MTLEEFKKSLKNPEPPADINNLLKALWYDGNNDWEMAHTIVQDLHSKDASWIHAYLHRKEGDTGNASYWYHRADKNMPGISLQDEWVEIVKMCLDEY